MPTPRKTRSLKVTDARQHFSELTNRVFRDRSRVIIEKSGIPVAALISPQDLDRLEWLEAQRERDFAILDEIGEAFAETPRPALEREVAKAIDAVRGAPSARRRSGASSVRATRRPRTVR